MVAKSYFPEGIMYNKENGVVRTSKTNSLFSSIPYWQRVIEGNKKGNLLIRLPFFNVVPTTGFEPAHPFEYHHLKVACLPISTHGL